MTKMEIQNEAWKAFIKWQGEDPSHIMGSLIIPFAIRVHNVALEEASKEIHEMCCLDTCNGEADTKENSETGNFCLARFHLKQLKIKADEGKQKP